MKPAHSNLCSGPTAFTTRLASPNSPFSHHLLLTLIDLLLDLPDLVPQSSNGLLHALTQPDIQLLLQYLRFIVLLLGTLVEMDRN